MPKQVDVHVKEILRDNNGRPTGTGEPITISYKSFLMLNDPDQPRFELLGEVESVDKDGNVKLREGNPNLDAQYRQQLRQAPQKSAEPVVNTGPTAKEIEQQQEIERLKQLLAQQPPAGQAPAAGNGEPVKEKRKRRTKAEMEGAGV